MDAMVDWKVLQPVFGRNHYDSRVVRSCRPGFDEQTDPGGNGKWSEPNGWGGRTPQGLHRGFGYQLDDDSLNVSATQQERFQDSGSADLPGRAPSTFGQGAARIRTLYQNGSRAACNPLPVGDPNFYGCD